MSASTANAIQQMQAMSGDTLDTMPTTSDAFTLPITSMAPNIVEGHPDYMLGMDDSFSWEMIGLGLEEPMPSQEAIDELYVKPLGDVKSTKPM